jgi:hypothetical protein
MAADPEAAYQFALAMGDFYEQQMREAGTPSEWTFLGLADLDRVREDEIPNGTMLYSWTSNEDPDEIVLSKEQLACFLNDDQSETQPEAP